ncbi:hypothetical protein CTI12_AA361310 [Artemisia annua]|uniref:Protein kinase domain-containing protein n=1 Tax=Artemisia annua TaxID=35608 RepID=A0A2U1MNJ8_ARTAN|nr:hypothetical protein CTI12_AA361310 [Artemisia annua]
MVNEWQHLKIPFREIKVATENFKTLIGQGGYGWVYKGKLLVPGKETTVAVKRLDEKFGQGLKEFWTEIQLLSGQQHPNVISLVGYCDEGREQCIVYEYAERGSLDQYIRHTRKNTSTTLTWLQRLKICADAARGLDHLHNHGYIKSSNILIDKNWVSKISDLGLSKLSVSGFGMSLLYTKGCGTPGYGEPEYHSTGVVTKKSDVYSFGVVLFEVLCGRLCLSDSDDGFSLSNKSAKYHYEKNSLDKIIDQSLRKHIGSYSMTKFSKIAYRCLHDDREQRPDMDVVLKELEKALEEEEDATVTGFKILTGILGVGAWFFLLSEEYEHSHLSAGHSQRDKVATDNFKTLIGQGGYSWVYKGKLLVFGKETAVAVKRLDEKFGQGLKEFLTDIQLLSGQQHPNVISLVGYCDEGREKCIVYEYAEHGSLDQGNDIHDRNPYAMYNIKSTLFSIKLNHGGFFTSSPNRIYKDGKITFVDLIDCDEFSIHEIDSMLEDLEYDGRRVMFYHFLKPDYDLDNGLEPLACDKDILLLGYGEPEYHSTGVVSKKSDVYSFRVFLFEVLCGRLCLGASDDGFSLSSKPAKYHYENNSLYKIMDDSLREHMGSYSMTKFSEIAYRCLHDDREQRPAMDVVLKELEEALKYQEYAKVYAGARMVGLFLLEVFVTGFIDVIFKHRLSRQIGWPCVIFTKWGPKHDKKSYINM